jgi:hypothetical protein
MELSKDLLVCSISKIIHNDIQRNGSRRILQQWLLIHRLQQKIIKRIKLRNLLRGRVLILRIVDQPPRHIRLQPLGNLVKQILPGKLSSATGNQHLETIF